MDEERGHAASAGADMGSELDAIQQRLRSLKRRLAERQAVVALDDPAGSGIASGDAVEMNPLTALPPD